MAAARVAPVDSAVDRDLRYADGADRRQFVTFEPNEKLEAVFGRYPPLDDSPSRALGLYDDGTPDNLACRATGAKDTL